MKALFKFILRLFGINKIHSGKITLIGSMDNPVHIHLGFCPRDIFISTQSSKGHHGCSHDDDDWFSWTPTHNGFIFKAKISSNHREVFWTALK